MSVLSSGIAQQRQSIDWPVIGKRKTTVARFERTDSCEVYLAPVPGTAEGKVVVDRQLFRGEDIRDLTLTFKAGRLVEMTAKSGLEPFKVVYDAATEGKDELSFIDIGVSSNGVLPPGSDLDAWVASGMVSVGLGNNYWSGSDNRSTLSSAHFLHGATPRRERGLLLSISLPEVGIEQNLQNNLIEPEFKY